jgi:hypothetical protein
MQLISLIKVLVDKLAPYRILAKRDTALPRKIWNLKNRPVGWGIANGQERIPINFVEEDFNRGNVRN